MSKYFSEWYMGTLLSYLGWCFSYCQPAALMLQHLPSYQLPAKETIKMEVKSSRRGPCKGTYQVSSSLQSNPLRPASLQYCLLRGVVDMLVHVEWSLLDRTSGCKIDTKQGLPPFSLIELPYSAAWMSAGHCAMGQSRCLVGEKRKVWWKGLQR